MVLVLLIQLKSFAGHSDLARALGEFNGQLQILKGMVVPKDEELKQLEDSVLQKIQFVLNTPVQNLQANLTAKSTHEKVANAFSEAVMLLARWGTKIVEAVRRDHRVTGAQKTEIEQWMKRLETIQQEREAQAAALRAAYASPEHGYAQRSMRYHSIDDSITKALECYDHITSIATSLFTQGWPSPIEEPSGFESFAPGALRATFHSGKEIKPVERMTNLLALSRQKPENTLKMVLSS